MPWEFTDHGVLGFIWLLLPIIIAFLSTILLGMSIDTDNAAGVQVASLLIIICLMLLWILVPIELGWLIKYCKI